MKHVIETALLFVAAALAGAVIAFVLRGTSTDPRVSGDFLCTINGDQSFMVEDIERASADGLVWRVETEGMVYRYAQLSGEVCSTEKAK